MPSDHPNITHDEPLIDLDDHRQILAGMNVSSPGRRNTNHTIDESLQPKAISSDFVARDFEQAVTDDGASINSQHGNRPRHLTQRGTMRKNRRSSNKSREDSPSPPNPLDAFNLGRHSAMSGDNEAAPGFSSRRRLTFSSGKDKGDGASISSESTNTEAEQDVCYPQDDHPADGPEIDFEELEEYVAEIEHTAPGSPAAVVPMDSLLNDTAFQLPSPTIDPQEKADDAWAELEKVKNLSGDDRRTGLIKTGKSRPFYSFFSPENASTIHATSLGGLLADGESFKDLFMDNVGAAWWLDVVRPTEEEVSVLCKAFSVHPLTREDITQEESRDKVELFNHYYFVAFRSFDDDQESKEYLEPIHYYAVVFRYGILTFSQHATPHSKNVLQRIAKLRDYMQLSTDWIAYALIDDIVDCFMPVIDAIDHEVDIIEDNVFIAREDDARQVLRSIGEVRKKCMGLLRLLGGKSDVIKGFAKRCIPAYEIAPTSDVGMYLSDIQDHIVTMRDNLTHSEQLLSRIHTNFLAQVSIDNINSGNKTNKMLGKVTLIAAILVPMNLVTGLFGMNVPVPWGLAPGPIAAWFGILGFVAFFSIVCVIIFRSMRLI